MREKPGTKPLSAELKEYRNVDAPRSPHLVHWATIDTEAGRLPLWFWQQVQYGHGAEQLLRSRVHLTMTNAAVDGRGGT